MRLVLSALFLFNIGFFSNSFAQNKKKLDDPIVATVNGKKIRKSTLYRYHRDNLKFVNSSKKVTLEGSLDDLINRIIGIDRAKKNKLAQNPVVAKKMNDVLYHAQISKDLEGELKKIKVSDGEVENYYKNHPEYRTAQILFRLRAVPDPEEVKKTFKKAMDVYTKVSKKPEDFLSYAQQYSQSSSAINGGDLGYQPNTRLTPEYYEAIKGKKVGTVLKPFRSQYGIHIVKVLGKKTAEQINKDMYKKIIYDTKRDKIVDNYFAGLRKQATVKIDKKQLQ